MFNKFSARQRVGIGTVSNRRCLGVIMIVSRECATAPHVGHGVIVGKRKYANCAQALCACVAVAVLVGECPGYVIQDCRQHVTTTPIGILHKCVVSEAVGFLDGQHFTGNTIGSPCSTSTLNRIANGVLSRWHDGQRIAVRRQGLQCAAAREFDIFLYHRGTFYPPARHGIDDTVIFSQ